MLYTNGKKANRLQNCMHAFYFECKHIKEAIEQYEFLLNSDDEELNIIMDKYSKEKEIDCAMMIYARGVRF